MKKLLLGVIAIAMPSLCLAMAEPAPEPTDIYFKAGTLELTIPFKAMDVVSLYDFIGKQALVGGETTIARAFDILSLTVGIVTTAGAEGTPIIGADLYTGNALDRYVNLGPLRIGGFGGFSFRAHEAIAGLKASVRLW